MAVIGVAEVRIAVAYLILGRRAEIGASPLNATTEGEHRFFLCYGLVFPWCVPDVEKKRRPLDLVGVDRHPRGH